MDNEEQAIAAVIESLAAAFPDVPGWRVRECVNQSLATFINAKVRNFVPILVARQARAALAVSRPDSAAGELRQDAPKNNGTRGFEPRTGVELEDMR